MKCVEVDYGGTAFIWIPDDMDPAKAFSTMANQMFGIRKSITRRGGPAYYEASREPPETLVPFDMALAHSGDLATFTSAGEKIIDEWGNVYGVPEEQLIGAARITGRTDYKKLAQELQAKEEVKT